MEKRLKDVSNSSQTRVHSGEFSFLMPIAGQEATLHMMDTFQTHYFLFGTMDFFFFLSFFDIEGFTMGKG